MPRRDGRRVQTEIPEGADAMRGARLAMVNSRHLLESAEHLAAAGNVAPAVALLVLAAEEAEKAYMYGMLSIGIDASSVGAQSILNSHTARHERSRALNALVALVIPFREHIERTRHQADAGVLPPPNEVRKSLLESLAAGADILSADTPTSQLLRAELEWLKTANAIKQRALYVDRTPAGWSSPNSVTRADYDIGRAAVSRVIESRSELLSDIEAMPEDVREGLLAGLDRVRRVAQRHDSPVTASYVSARSRSSPQRDQGDLSG